MNPQMEFLEKSLFWRLYFVEPSCFVEITEGNTSKVPKPPRTNPKLSVINYFAFKPAASVIFKSAEFSTVLVLTIDALIPAPPPIANRVKL